MEPQKLTAHEVIAGAERHLASLSAREFLVGLERLGTVAPDVAHLDELQVEPEEDGFGVYVRAVGKRGVSHETADRIAGLAYSHENMFLDLQRGPNYLSLDSIRALAAEPDREFFAR